MELDFDKGYEIRKFWAEGANHCNQEKSLNFKKKPLEVKLKNVNDLLQNHYAKNI